MDAKIYFWPQKIYDWTQTKARKAVILQSKDCEPAHARPKMQASWLSLNRSLAPKNVSNMNINILAATAAPSFADILAWCFPLIVIVASAIGFGFAAYYWGRNARIENYLRRRKEEANRASRQNQPN